MEIRIVITLIVVIIILYYLIDYLRVIKPKIKQPVSDFNFKRKSPEEIERSIAIINEMRNRNPDDTTENEFYYGAKAAPRFVHKTIYDYWNQFVAMEHKWIVKSEKNGAHYVELISKLMLYLDEVASENYSSVTCSFGRLKSSEKDRELDKECILFKADGSDELYATIDVITHTFNVVEIATKKTKGISRAYEWFNQIGPSIIAAIAHDIGKIEKQKNPKEKRSHHVVSVELFHRMAQGLLPQPVEEEIAQAILLHHDPFDVKKDNLTRIILAQAEAAARENELKEYLKNNPNGLGKKIDERTKKINEAKENLKIGIINCLLNPGNNRHQMVFDKKKNEYVYIYNELMKRIAKENNIDPEIYATVLKKLRDEAIITLINFEKYEVYRADLKYHDGSRCSVDLFPINYMKLGFTLIQLHKIFSGFVMPRLSINFGKKE